MHRRLSGPYKIRLGACNVASGRRSLRTRFRLLAITKYDFSEVEKSMIECVVSHKLGILYNLTYPKCDLGEVEKAMYEVVA